MIKAIFKFFPKRKLCLFYIGLSLFFLPKEAYSKLNVNQAKSIQNTLITGKITNENDQAIVGATIKTTKSGKQTKSKEDGSFEIEVSKNDQITVTYLGYESTTLAPSSLSMTIKLQPSNNTLSDVVVVGYVKKNKSQIVSSVSTVSSKELLDVTSNNTANLLQGKAAGVVVSNSSGQPGSAPNITIRGRGTIGANTNPLTVVDGVIGGTAFPSDIESVTVLKDAGATGLYGSRAANGVIVITTKHGKNGKTLVTYNGSAGVSNMTTGNFSLMNGNQLKDYYGALYKNDYQNKRQNYIDELSTNSPNPNESQINDYLKQNNFPTNQQSFLDQYLPQNPNNTNWLKEAFKTAAVQSHSVGVSGGNEKTKFYIGAAYYNEKGTLINTGFNNINTRVNLEHQLSKSIKLTARINASISNNKDEPTGALYQSFTNMPWDKPYNEDGSPKFVTQGSQGWYGRDGANFVYDNQYNYNITKTNKLDGDFKFEYKINDWLSFSSTNRYSTRFIRNEQLTDARSAAGKSNNGSLSNSFSDESIGLSSNLLSFNKSFKKHHFNSILGFEYQTNFLQDMNGTGIGIFPSLNILDVTSTPTSLGGSKTKNVFISELFMTDYNYDNKYFATVSTRVDASSVFGINNQYGLFYSLAGGWIVSNEKWFQSKLITSLKLRGSYGVTGNTPTDNYGSLDLYSFSSSYAGITGGIPDRQSNNLLTWEKPVTIDFGANISLWNRVEISFDIYQRTNKALLQNVPLSAASGFASITKNVGVVRNKGIDLELSTKNIIKNKFKWSTNFNISLNKNIVQSLNGGNPIQNGINIIQEGQDMNSFYMRAWAGVDPENGKPLWKQGTQTTSKYNQADRMIVGSSTPKFSGGMGNNFEIGAFTVSAFLNFVYGNKVYNYARELFDADGAYPTYNTMQLANGWSRWTTAGQKATQPQSLINGNSLSNKISSRYLEDGSYLRLRNVNIGYKLPQSFLNKLHLNSASVFLSADNLLTITKFSGMDPEVDLSTGNTNIKYPLARKYMFGINFSL